MYMINNSMIVSIGSSCASEGFIEILNKDNNLGLEFKSGFFDFTIVSPKSIIEFFNYFKTDNIIDILSDKNNYEKVLLSNGTSVFKHLMFDCLYLWHETLEQLPSNFKDKTIHKLNSLFDYPGQICFCLNNTMQQTKNNLKLANDDPNKIIISYDQFIEIKCLAKELFNADVLIKTLPNFSIGFPNNKDFYDLNLKNIKNFLSN